MKKITFLSILCMFLTIPIAMGQSSFTSASGPNGPSVINGPAGATTANNGSFGNLAPQVITYNTTQNITPGLDIACASETSFRDNSMYVDFDLSNDFAISDDFDVASVEFAIGTISTPTSFPITVNVWSSVGDFPTGTLTLQGSAVHTAVNSQAATIVSVPVTATIPAGSKMVIELKLVDDGTNTHVMRFGCNNDGFGGESWIQAADCGAPTPTPFGTLGLSQDVVLNVVGEEATGGGTVYCTASGNNPTYENITNVTYAGINNTTTTHSGYNDFTAQVANVTQGETDELSVTITADGSDYVYAFIDWNQNGVLDDAGEVYTLATSTSVSGPHTMNIAVPAGASLGDTRMRVKVGWLQSTPDPCGTFSYGEIEDYTVNVQAPTTVTYCTASGNSPTYENITNVTYAGINNTTTTHSGYNDFTAQVANVTQGNTDQISVTITADGSDYVYAFIDWNQNGILDDAGEVYTLATSTSSAGPHTMNITVPMGASLGDTRMRVKVGWLQSTPNPCGTFSYGEIEDYTVNVQAAGGGGGNPPTIACPADIVGNNDPGTCGAVVNFAGVAFDDEDGNISGDIIATPASGSIFPVGNTTVELSVTDSDGNTSTCQFTVTVIDNENPIAVCQDVTVDLDASGSYTLTAAELDNGSTDNCGIASYELGMMGSGGFSLTTTFAGGNALAGSMFDLEAVNDITIDSFDVNMATGDTATIEVYYKTGTWVGSESTASAWTLVGTATGITSAGVGLPTPLNLDLDISVAAGNRVAFYVTRTTGSLTYTNGTTVGALFASDANLQMFEGAGKGYPFGSTFQPRNFNGNIVYSTDGTLVPFSGVFDCSNIGTNEVYLMITDNSGNVSSCIATVTVQDVTAPDIVCVGGFGSYSESEDFEGATIPAGWTTNVLVGTHDWTFGSGDMPTGGDFPTNAAIFDDNEAGMGQINVAELLSPVYNLTGATSADVSFDYALQEYIGAGNLTVEVYDGSTWHQILYVDVDTNPTNTGAIDVLAHANAAFQVKFTFDDDEDWGWGAGVDNFLLNYEAASGGGLDVYLDANGMASINPMDLLVSVDEACGYTITTGGGGGGGGTPGSLATMFASGNNGSPGGAVYFDITVGPNDLDVSAIDINTADPGAFTMSVYSLTGTYVGNEDNAAAWGAADAVASGTGAGQDAPSNAVLDNPITLTANTTYGMALVLDATHSHYYTNGDGSNQNFSNADMAMALGAASNTPFTTPIFAPRIFNGAIHYTSSGGGGGSGVDFTCADLGENIIEVTVTDASGNSSTCMAVVNVIDNIAPVLTCGTAAITTELEDFEGSSLPAGWSTDIINGTHNWTFGSGTMPTGGNFPTNAAIFNDDAAGNGQVNKASLISPVYDISGSIAASISFDYAMQEFAGDGTLAVEVYDGSAWQQILFVDVNTNPTNSGSLDMMPYMNANFQVKFTYDDENSWAWGAGIDNFEITYEASASGNIVNVALGADGTATIDPYALLSNIEEACGIATIATDVTTVTCADIGTPIMVTVFVSDTSGNIASCIAEVHVVDLLGPVITCPADQTVDPGPGNLFYLVPDYFATGEATADDNCTDPVTITTQDPAPGAALPEGPHTITLTATDEYGNSSTCSFEITVETILGANQNSLDTGVTLYPNPASHVVNLVNKTNISLEKMIIFDINGKMVSQINLNTMQGEKAIDVSALATGVYVVQIIGDNVSTVKRLIKE